MTMTTRKFDFNLYFRLLYISLLTFLVFFTIYDIYYFSVTNIFFYIFIVAYFFLFIALLKLTNNLHLLLIFLVAIYSFQNIYIGILIEIYDLSISKIKILLMIKDITVMFILLLLFLIKFPLFIKKSFIKNFILVLLVFILLITYLLLYRIDTFTALAYFRNFSFPFVFTLLGFVLIKNNHDKIKFYKYLIVILSIVSIISLNELVFNQNMWKDLGALKINIARGFGNVDVLRTVVLNKEITRIGGTFLDSVNFSYFLAGSIGILLSSIRLFCFYIRLYIFFLIIFLHIFFIFTFGKGGWLIYILIITVIILPKRIINKPKYFYLLLVFLIILIIISIPLLIKIFPTTIYHFTGLINSLINTSLFGHGLGSGGNFLKGFRQVTWEEWMLSSESGLGTMLYQLGIFFTLLYYFVLFLFIKKLYHNYIKITASENSYLKNEIKVLIFTLIGWVLASIFQENAFSPNANFLLFLWLGILLKTLKMEKNYV
jgi:hypothetical protein